MRSPATARQPLRTADIEWTPAFYDVDPMLVVWHGHYLKFFERARAALFGSFGYGYEDMAESGYAWPIVDLRVKFVRPVRIGQRLKVHASLVEWENRVRVEYLVRDAQRGEVLTRGWSIQVAVDTASGEMQYVCPPVLLRKLGLAP
ncbi:MAG: 4-hydroxybenzoyl-CoA thioesterase [Lysobacteraceae bacterium]|nr:MAG: 4-hydroxybenzoyl-CoA thioesterase [Xanthomonadaceae bacterium]